MNKIRVGILMAELILSSHRMPSRISFFTRSVLEAVAKNIPIVGPIFQGFSDAVSSATLSNLKGRLDVLEQNHEPHTSSLPPESREFWALKVAAEIGALLEVYPDLVHLPIRNHYSVLIPATHGLFLAILLSLSFPNDPPVVVLCGPSGDVRLECPFAVGAWSSHRTLSEIVEAFNA